MSSHLTIQETLKGFQSKLQGASENASLSKETFIKTSEGITGYINDLSPFKFMDNLGTIRSIYSLLENQTARFSIVATKKDTQSLEERTEVWPRGEIKNLHLRLQELEEAGDGEGAKGIADEIETIVEHQSPFQTMDNRAFIESLRERTETLQSLPPQDKLETVTDSLDLEETGSVDGMEDVQEAEEADVPFWKKAVAIGLIGLVLVAPFLAIPGLMMTGQNNSSQTPTFDLPRGGTALIPPPGTDLHAPLQLPPAINSAQTSLVNNTCSANPMTPFLTPAITPLITPQIENPITLTGSEVVPYGTSFEGSQDICPVQGQGTLAPFIPSQMQDVSVNPGALQLGSLQAELPTLTQAQQLGTSQELVTYSASQDAPQTSELSLTNFNQAEFQPTQQATFNIQNIDHAAFQFTLGEKTFILDLKNPMVQKAFSQATASQSNPALVGSQDGLIAPHVGQQSAKIFFIENGMKMQMDVSYDPQLLQNVISQLNQPSTMDRPLQLESGNGLRLYQAPTVNPQKPNLLQKVSNFLPPKLEVVPATSDKAQKLPMPALYSPLSLPSDLRSREIVEVGRNETAV